jgi:hypothetical protein
VISPCPPYDFPKFTFLILCQEYCFYVLSDFIKFSTLYPSKKKKKKKKKKTGEENGKNGEENVK